MNKYLEKTSSFIAGGIAAHLAQNLVSKTAIRSSAVGKSLGTAFANGVKGVSDKGIGHTLKHGVMGAVSPDIAVMHKSMSTFGNKAAPILNSMSPREKVSLRHLSRGNFVKLHDSGLHKNPNVQKIVDLAHTHTSLGIGKLSDLSREGAAHLETVWKSKDHPILSNLAKHIGEGRASATATAGKASIKASGVGAALSSVVDPASGVLSSAKTFAASHFSDSNKYLAKAKGLVEKTFVKTPISKGFNSPGKDFLHGVKNRASELMVNPVSSSLKHTSSAISETFRK